MKKKVVYGWLMALVFSLLPAIAMAGGEWGSLQKEVAPTTSASNDLPSDAKSITVYLVVGTNAVVPKDAYYSPSENRIYIMRGKIMMHFIVHENPQYGQESAAGKYKYRAGDYFLDL